MLLVHITHLFKPLHVTFSVDLEPNVITLSQPDEDPEFTSDKPPVHDRHIVQENYSEKL